MQLNEILIPSMKKKLLVEVKEDITVDTLKNNILHLIKDGSNKPSSKYYILEATSKQRLMDDMMISKKVYVGSRFVLMENSDDECT